MISKCWLWNHLPANKNPIEFATANLWVGVLDISSLSESVWILTLRMERKEKSFTSFGSSAGAAIFDSVFSQNFTAKKLWKKSAEKKKSQRWFCFEKVSWFILFISKAGKFKHGKRSTILRVKINNHTFFEILIYFSAVYFIPFLQNIQNDSKYQQV